MGTSVGTNACFHPDSVFFSRKYCDRLKLEVSAEAFRFDWSTLLAASGRIAAHTCEDRGENASENRGQEGGAEISPTAYQLPALSSVAEGVDRPRLNVAGRYISSRNRSFVQLLHYSSSTVL